MIWPEGDADAADWRALQRKQEEYARELDAQIEQRRAAREEEQRAREELERRLRPAERSPSKWLVDGGRVGFEGPGEADLWAFKDGGEVGDAGAQRQVHGADTGEQLTPAAASPFTRFRVTDESQASERLRERAQQLEWKRVLDEQVRENARLRAAQDEERRRAEQEAVREEVQFLREQQLRAQRKLGYAGPEPSPSAYAPSTSRREYRAIPDPQVNATENANAASRVSARRRFQIGEDTRTQAEPSAYMPSQYGAVSGATGIPPPAPSRSHVKNSFAPANASNTYGGNNDTAVENDDAGSSFNYSQSRVDVIEQYRGLLNEIRREREELRREREEVRREKEELRIQRALIELENEKMASLVDAQRRLAEQQIERQQRDADTKAQYQRQQQMEMALQVPDMIPGDLERLPTPSIPVTPQRSNRYNRVDNIRDSLAKLKIKNAATAVEAPTPPRRLASPMSMAEFTALGNAWGRPVLSPANSPAYPRRSAANLQQELQTNWVDEFAENEQPLDQSLVGESVFVPVEPIALSIPTTLSPSVRNKRTESNDPRSPLRNSRIIKSRGFYDLSQEFAPPVKSGNTPAKAQVSTRQQEQKYEEESEESEEVDEQIELEYLEEEAGYGMSGVSNSRLGDMFAVVDSPYRGDGSWSSDLDYTEAVLDSFVRGDIDEEAKDNANASSRTSGLFKVHYFQTGANEK